MIIFAISFVLRQFQELKAVQYAFNGIRAGVMALLCKALWGMYKKNKKNWKSFWKHMKRSNEGMNYIFTMTASGTCIYLAYMLIRRTIGDRLAEKWYYMLLKATVAYFLIPLPFLKQFQ